MEVTLDVDLLPIFLTIIIVVVGVSVQVILGYFKNRAESFPKKISINYSRIGSTSVVGIITGILLVGPQINKIDLSDPVLDTLIVATTLVASVAGIDTLTNHVIKSQTKSTPEKSDSSTEVSKRPA